MLNKIRRLIGQPEIHRVPVVQFIGEQDGPSERDLKASVFAILARHAHVHRAYLARIAYDGAEVGAVALCLVGRQDPDLAATIGREFARLFATGVPLDIVFVWVEEEAILCGCVSPFSIDRGGHLM